jgi:hypothetical protein
MEQEKDGGTKRPLVDFVWVQGASARSLAFLWKVHSDSLPALTVPLAIVLAASMNGLA